MCGIFAAVSNAPIGEDRIDIVAHRGPDGRGWWGTETPAGRLVLGHRRLAIIDLTDDGLQPMHEADGRGVITFNGEIYNYRELRTELESGGVRFHTQSDTEVLLAVLRHWGLDGLQRLRGMFAFVHYDPSTQRMTAVRDRFGIKPLYIVERAGVVAFGSEIKQLIGLGGAGQRMNMARVADFVAYGFSDHTNETMFDGIGQIPPGSLAVIDLSHRTPVVRHERWYRPELRLAPTVSAADAAEGFRQRFEDSVRLHLRSDVRNGSCLSGGLDSSSIVCMAARIGVPRDTFTAITATYDVARVDELRFAQMVATETNLELQQVRPVGDDLLALGEQATWYQDEPFGSTSVLAQWHVFQEARRLGIKVMLDGQGADEQLAGYHSEFGVHHLHLLRSLQLGALYRSVTGRRRLSATSLAAQGREIIPYAAPTLLRFARRRVQFGDWAKGGSLEPILARADPRKAASALGGHAAPSDIATACFDMVHGSHLPRLLRFEDRSSMAHGVEARVPFLDHPLVEYNLALGNQHKLVDGRTKMVLRAAMTGILPQGIVDRHDKLGFATPEAEWARGPARDALRQGVEATLTWFPGLLNAAAVRQMADGMLSGRVGYNMILWRIVNLGLWGRRFNLAA